MIAGIICKDIEAFSPADEGFDAFSKKIYVKACNIYEDIVRLCTVRKTRNRPRKNTIQKGTVFTPEKMTGSKKP
jgi:hypothetical protein